jgi:hypothetical protein
MEYEPTFVGEGVNDDVQVSNSPDELLVQTGIVDPAGKVPTSVQLNTPDPTPSLQL